MKTKSKLKKSISYLTLQKMNKTKNLKEITFHFPFS